MNIATAIATTEIKLAGYYEGPDDLIELPVLATLKIADRTLVVVMNPDKHASAQRRLAAAFVLDYIDWNDEVWDLTPTFSRPYDNFDFFGSTIDDIRDKAVERIEPRVDGKTNAKALADQLRAAGVDVISEIGEALDCGCERFAFTVVQCAECAAPRPETVLF